MVTAPLKHIRVENISDPTPIEYAIKHKLLLVAQLLLAITTEPKVDASHIQALSTVTKHSAMRTMELSSL